MACLPIVPVAVTLYCARAGAASTTVTTMSANLFISLLLVGS
jgi:hypothetical protein